MNDYTKIQPHIITIDGPSGSGKGTISQNLATRLQWHFLDSGAIYRILALAVLNAGMVDANAAEIAQLAHYLDAHFSVDHTDSHAQIYLDGVVVTQLIRSEKCGEMASKIAIMQEVRQALLNRQRAYATLPGLIADGRDMGTVVFPDAALKIYLDASAEERAKRRYKQLKQQGIDVNLDQIFADLKTRDKRDKNRTIAPLKPAVDALLIDTTHLSIEEVQNLILHEAKARNLI